MSLAQLRINHLALIILGARRADYETGNTYISRHFLAKIAGGNR
jgi:hypothetical protein